MLPWKETKRPSLEQMFHKIVLQPSIEFVNLKKSSFLQVTPTGIVVADNSNGTREIPPHIIILATGFDAGSGSLTKIDIHGTTGRTLKNKGAKGTRIQLSIATAVFPNLFFLYGPQSPGAFAIDPAAAEVQGDWIINYIKNLKNNGHTQIEALVPRRNGLRSRTSR